MNWGALLAELRVDLDDTSTNPKFSNQMLYVYLREAINDYSQWLPLTKSDVTLVQDAENAKKFALPVDFLAEISVACPADRFLEPRRGRLGANVVPGNRPYFYRLDDVSLVLDVDPGSLPVVLSYEALHVIPTDAADLTCELTVPLVNMELIKLYIEGKVNAKIRNAQARLDRFKLGAGSRDDNPMIPEVEDFFAAYRSLLAARVPTRPVTLYRPRRYR